MFQRRLVVLLTFLGVLTLAALARMAELQIARGHDFREEASQMLLRPLRFIPSVRGRIVDRNGTVLASEEPSWSICVHYGLIAEDQIYLRRLARSRGVSVEALRAQVERMWRQLPYLSGMTAEEITAKRARLVRRVERIRANFERYHGYEGTMIEEVTLHPIVTDLTDQAQVQARLVLADTPGVEVRASSSRRYFDHPSLGHLLGRLGEVGPDELDHDPFGEDPLRGYQAGDLFGVSGVEYLAEAVLRGHRGQIIENRDGDVVRRIEPRRGGDVALSLDTTLQARIYEMMMEAIAENESGAGGAAVILDVATREVLALVSAPGYEPSAFRERYRELLGDTVGMPLRFRAVSGVCAPGSIVKPAVLTAALAGGTVSPAFSVICEGSLFPSQPGIWREWSAHQNGLPMRHGLVDGEAALKNSCNIYFYTVGEMVGPQQICDWLLRFGLGSPSGTGLLEEASGVVPTAPWLMANRDRRYRTADGRNYALGQGEILANPVQAANLAAVYASGVYMPVALMLDDGSQRGVRTLPAAPGTWEIVRRGMWRVVNEQGGTAHNTVRLRSSDYEICGKSGSAQASCRAVAYAARWTDGEGQERQRIVPATNQREALAALEGELGASGVSLDGVHLEVAQWWPWAPGDKEDMPTHAWFIGFLEPRSDGRRLPQAQLAFAVMLEYGGSGGRQAGPLAANILQLVIDEFPQYLRN